MGPAWLDRALQIGVEWGESEEEKFSLFDIKKWGRATRKHLHDS